MQAASEVDMSQRCYLIGRKVSEDELRPQFDSRVSKELADSGPSKVQTSNQIGSGAQRGQRSTSNA